VATSLVTLVIAVVVSPQVSGGGDLQSSLTITTIVFGAVGLGCYLWCFFTSRERVPRSVATASMRELIRMLKENKPLVLLCCASLLFLAGMFSLQTVAVYYARDVLGDTNLYVVLTIVSTVCMIAASLGVPKLVGSLGKKKAWLV
jgi:glucuronide carrier protein